MDDKKREPLRVVEGVKVYERVSLIDEMYNEPIHEVIYARVSDVKKKSDGERRQDIDRQLESICRFVKAKGMDSIVIYSDDGKSAFTDDINQRPQFKQLLNDCKRRIIKKIYIEDMTRFSRNLSMGLQWMRLLGDLNIDLISLREGEFEVTSSSGWMRSTFLLMFAEMDSRIKSEKVRDGMQKAKNLGKNIGRPKNKKK